MLVSGAGLESEEREEGMSDEKILFDGSDAGYLEYFLFFLLNVVSPKVSEGKEHVS